MEGIPLKNSPSQTELGMSTNERDFASTNIGDTPMTTLTSMMKTEDPNEVGMTNNNFETLYEPTEPGRPDSAITSDYVSPPYPKNGKLFDSILEILNAEQTLQRVNELQIGEGPSILSSMDVDQVMEFKTDAWILTKDEAREIAQEIIADLEEDLAETLKFRGMHFTIPDKMDRRYYI